MILVLISLSLNIFAFKEFDYYFIYIELPKYTIRLSNAGLFINKKEVNMGFIKEVYSGNRAGLVVAFGRESSDNFYSGDNIEEAMKYFNMYLKNNQLYIKSEDSTALDNLGFEAKNASEIRSALDEILEVIPDEEIKKVMVLFPNWKEGVKYNVGERVRFNETIYKVLQEHVSQADWTPEFATSLFANLLIDEETNKVQEWIQPDSTNGYMIGNQVFFEGILYESLIDNNVWSPAEYPAGWKEIFE